MVAAPQGHSSAPGPLPCLRRASLPSPKRWLARRVPGEHPRHPAVTRPASAVGRRTDDFTLAGRASGDGSGRLRTLFRLKTPGVVLRRSLLKTPPGRLKTRNRKRNVTEALQQQLSTDRAGGSERETTRTLFISTSTSCVKPSTLGWCLVPLKLY